MWTPSSSRPIFSAQQMSFSSSTTRTSSIEFLRRQDDSERGALPYLALDTNHAPMLVDEAVGDRKAQPCPLPRWHGSEEGIKDAGKVLLMDATPGVCESDLDCRRRSRRGKSALDGELPSLFHGVVGVHDDIHEHLLKLIPVALHLRKRRGQLFGDIDRLKRDLMADEGERFLDSAVHIHLLGQPLRRSSEP